MSAPFLKYPTRFSKLEADSTFMVRRLFRLRMLVRCGLDYPESSVSLVDCRWHWTVRGVLTTIMTLICSQPNTFKGSGVWTVPVHR